MELRLCAEEPQTLATVGLELGVTRERIRQLQARLQKSINARISRDVGTLARLLAARLPATTDAETLDVQVARVLTYDESLAARLARSSLKTSSWIYRGAWSPLECRGRSGNGIYTN